MVLPQQLEGGLDGDLGPVPRVPPLPVGAAGARLHREGHAGPRLSQLPQLLVPLPRVAETVIVIIRLQSILNLGIVKPL